MRRESNIIVISSVAIALVIIAYLARYFDPILTRLTDPLWVSVFATVALIVINAFYIVQNRQSLKEMEKARKTEFLPHLKVELAFLFPNFLILKLYNIGKGPATNINVKIIFSPLNEKRIVDQAVMMPNDPIRITLPDGSVKEACQQSALIKMQGSYEDLFGKSYLIDETIDTKKFIDDVTELDPLIEPNIPRYIQEIEHHLRDIATEMRRLKK